MNHIAILDFSSNPNIGLFAYATDSYCLVGREVSEDKQKELAKVLDVPVHQISLCGTSLIGIFCAGNDKTLLIPNITFENERKVLDDLGIAYTVIDTKLTALGNNILCNNNGAIVSTEFEEGAVAQIKDALGVPTIQGKIAELDIVGSVAVTNSKGHCIVHHDIAQFEKKLVEKQLKVTCAEGTVNLGSPYVHSGIIANGNGFAVGVQSGGPEIDNVDKALGYLQAI